MMDDQSKRISAVEAKSHAQWIAFGPFVFQAAVVMRDSGLLRALSDAGAEGTDVAALAERAGMSEYGASVLLDFGLDLGLAERAEAGFALGKVGHFVLNDEMTRVNMDFTRDCCYQALEHLGTAIAEGRPAGLKTLGPWATLYEGLSSLPEPASRSWFDFDHFYSDRVFRDLLPIVFERPVARLLDIGGNTGKWALECLRHDPEVSVTMADLPQQLEVARGNIEAAGFGERVDYYAIDLLDTAQPFPEGADVLWMSQLLDCFSEPEILNILQRAAAAMGPEAVLYIVELFPDRQQFEAARFSLNATSLYFTCVANGNSRMYRSDQMLRLVEAAGLTVRRDIDDVGVGHTVLACTRA